MLVVFWLLGHVKQDRNRIEKKKEERNRIDRVGFAARIKGETQRRGAAKAQKEEGEFFLCAFAAPRLCVGLIGLKVS